MRKIYSKVDPNILLHMVNRIADASEGRTDLVAETEFIQLAVIKMEKGKTFIPHKHIWKDGEEKAITQESWLVVRGKAKAILYDLDDTIIDTVILNPGDCTITLRGGHNYEFMEDDTVIYEHKTGPYKGRQKDKEFILQ
tara:strand:+ start:1610 stop:2026 length:417 start_codon:yes stop_codon:yes gene_type:complete